MSDNTFAALVQPEELEILLTESGDRVAIFDCRARLGDPGYGARGFAASHIAGAGRLDLDTDLAAPPGPRGRHPLPERAAFAARLGALGVGSDHQVVVYDDAGGMYAARAWWMLRWLGHAAVAVLDGGLPAWQGALEAGPARAATPHELPPRAPLTRQISAPEILERDDLVLLDARAQPRFDGVEEPIDPVAGHIPGAHCLPFQDNLGSDGRFLAPAQLRARFATVTAAAGPAVCYCGSGVTAAHNILAMHIAGLPEPALYPGSWSEWVADPARPTEPAHG